MKKIRKPSLFLDYLTHLWKALGLTVLERQLTDFIRGLITNFCECYWLKPPQRH